MESKEKAKGLTEAVVGMLMYRCDAAVDREEVVRLRTDEVL